MVFSCFLTMVFFVFDEGVLFDEGVPFDEGLLFFFDEGVFF